MQYIYAQSLHSAACGVVITDKFEDCIGVENTAEKIQYQEYSNLSRLYRLPRDTSIV